jgi:hypothetical protein
MSIYLVKDAPVEHNFARLAEGAKWTQEWRKVADKLYKEPRCDQWTVLVTTHALSFALGVATGSWSASLGLMIAGGGVWVTRRCYIIGKLQSKTQRVFQIYSDTILFIREKKRAKQDSLAERYNQLADQRKATEALALAALKELDEAYDALEEHAQFKAQVTHLSTHLIEPKVMDFGNDLKSPRDIQKELSQACGEYLAECANLLTENREKVFRA